MPRLGRDARDPGADGGVAPQVEPTLPGHVRVAVERDVGDAQAVADEVMTILAEVAFERRKRLVAAHLQRGQPVGMLLGAARVLDEEARDGDVRLEVVLLEEFPGQDLRDLVGVVRHEARPPGQIPEDRARLAQRAAVVQHERRHAQRRIEIADDVRTVGAVDDIELAALEGQTEVRRQQANLVAIAGDGRVVEDHAATIAGGRLLVDSDPR